MLYAKPNAQVSKHTKSHWQLSMKITSMIREVEADDCSYMCLKFSWENNQSFSPRLPIFITLRQGVHENRQSCMDFDHKKHEILGETTLNMTCLITFFYILLFNFRHKSC